MHQPTWIGEGINAGKPFHYLKATPWKHNLLNLSLLGLIYMGLGGVGALSVVVTPLVYIPFAGAAFGLMLFMLFILVVHEASHKMFIVCKDSEKALFWNRFFGSMVAIPFGHDYIQHWEKGHHLHHIYPMEEDKDPQGCLSPTGWGLAKKIGKLISLPGYYAYYSTKYGAGPDYECPAARSYDVRKKMVLARLVLLSAILMISIKFHTWSLPVAILLGTYVALTLNFLKFSMEHGGGIALHPNRNLRSRTSLFPLRRLLMPFNISLHFEHHLNYCVPWYNLPKYQRELMKIIPEELHAQIFNHHILKQLLGQLPGIKFAKEPEMLQKG